mmetsp:Transcript_7949/g.23257  ORF Transcript_7949/g.23257 Transcript_7949/m.23257 type:complete len:233 (+) Transcript_7949:94-792(+)
MPRRPMRCHPPVPRAWGSVSRVSTQPGRGGGGWTGAGVTRGSSRRGWMRPESTLDHPELQRHAASPGGCQQCVVMRPAAYDTGRISQRRRPMDATHRPRGRLPATGAALALPAYLLKSTPSSVSFLNALAKSLKKACSSAAYFSTWGRNLGSQMKARSEGSIMSSPEGSSYCSGPVQGLPLCVFFTVQVFSSISRKYSLEKEVSARVQGPQYPERSVWQRPRACAPASATIS